MVRMESWPWQLCQPRPSVEAVTGKVASGRLQPCCLQPPGVQVNFSLSAGYQQPCSEKWDLFPAGSVCLALPAAFESGCRAGLLAEQEVRSVMAPAQHLSTPKSLFFSASKACVC